MKKDSHRRDITTGISLPKEELNRFVLKDGHLLYDKHQSMEGRGVYLAKGKENLILAMKKNLLSRAFKKRIDPQEIERIIEEEGDNL